MKKRILSLVLALVMVLGVCPTPAFAAGGGSAGAEPGVLFTYDSAFGSITVDGAAVESGTALEIPDTGAALTALPSEGTAFLGWVDGEGAVLSTEPGYSLQPEETLTEVRAAFAAPEAEAWFYSQDRTHLYQGPEALENGSGTLVLAESGTLRETAYTIPRGLTVLLPYDSGHTELGSNNLTYANCSLINMGNMNPTGFANLDPEVDRNYLLTVPAGTTVFNNGALILGGVVGTKNMALNGGLIGAHSDMRLDGTLVLGSGSVLSAVGYIVGNGQVVTTGSGAKVYEPYIVCDFRSGGFAYASYFSNTKSGEDNLPLFYRYTVQNIQTGLTLSAGNYLYGYVTLYAYGNFQTDVVDLVGDGNVDALIRLHEGAELHTDYYPGRYAAITAPRYGEGQIGKTELTIRGGADYGKMTLHMAGQTFGMNEITFPVPYNYDIRLCGEGSVYSIPDSMSLYPGADLRVGEGATLNISSPIFNVYDGLYFDVDIGKEGENNYSGTRSYGTYGGRMLYPSTAQLQNGTVASNGTANLIVDGTLHILSGANFGGLIQTHGTGTVIVDPNATVKPKVQVGLVGHLDGGIEYWDCVAATVSSIPAMLYNQNYNTFYNLQSGQTFYGVGGSSHTLASSKSFDFYGNAASPSSKSTQTLVLNANVVGTWAAEEDIFVAELHLCADGEDKGLYKTLHLSLDGNPAGYYTDAACTQTADFYEIESGDTVVLYAKATAKIDTDYYRTLEDALGHGEAGDTVELLANQTLESPLTISRSLSLTLDLGGHRITNSSGAVITNYGSLTVQNGTLRGTEYISENPGNERAWSNVVYNQGTLALDDVTISTQDSGYRVGILNDTDGTISALNNVTVNATGENGRGILNFGAIEAISGGTINAYDGLIVSGGATVGTLGGGLAVNAYDGLIVSDGGTVGTLGGGLSIQAGRRGINITGTGSRVETLGSAEGPVNIRSQDIGILFSTSGTSVGTIGVAGDVTVVSQTANAIHLNRESTVDELGKGLLAATKGETKYAVRITGEDHTLAAATVGLISGGIYYTPNLTSANAINPGYAIDHYASQNYPRGYSLNRAQPVTIELDGESLQALEVSHDHHYADPVFTWSEDHTEATAELVCSTCDEDNEGHSVTVPCTVTTAENRGALATAEVDGRAYTDFYCTIGDGMTYNVNSVRASEKQLDTVPLTFEAWVRFDADATLSANSVIVGTYAGANGKYINLEIQKNGFPRLCYGTLDNKQTTGNFLFNQGSVLNGEWVHVAVVYNAETNQATYYRNGELVQTRSPESTQNANLTDATPTKGVVCLGTDKRSNNGSWFKGELASVALYSDVRTPEEIRSDMMVPGTEDQILHYEVSSKTGVTVYDLSGNGYDIGRCEHAYTVTFDWAEDNSSATATAVCSKCSAATDGHEVTQDCQMRSLNGRHEATATFEGQTYTDRRIAIESGMTYTTGVVCSQEKMLAEVPHTFEAWIKLPIGANRGVILGDFEKTGGIQYLSFEVYNNGYPRLCWHNGNSGGNPSIVFNQDVRTGEWVHLAITHDASIVTCYVNGEEIGRITETKPLPALPAATFVLGNDHRSGTKLPFQGEIASVSAWSDVRTPEEIKADMIVPGGEDLLLHYELSSTSTGAHVIPDLTGNGYDAYNTAHTFSAQFTWAEDYATATAEITCDACGLSSGTLPCTVTPMGERGYIATVTWRGTEYTDKKLTMEGMTFTADDQYAAQTILSTAPITYETWVKFPADFATDKNSVVIGSYPGGYGKFISFDIQSSGFPELSWSDKSNASSATGDIRFTAGSVFTGNWEHVALVYDPDTKQASYYLNGELIGTASDIKTNNADLTEAVPVTKPMVLGGNYRADHNPMYFKGEVASVALYSDVRTQEEIRADMVSPGTEALILHYELNGDSASASVIPDLSGNGYDIYNPWVPAPELEDYSFSFMVIGDTQKAVRNHADVFHKIYDYVLENVESKNVKFVFGLGDIVDNDTTAQWTTAQEQIFRLDGQVPYSIIRGNHDMVDGYNTYFPVSHYESVLGGYLEDMRNTWQTFTVNDIKYLVLNLDFGPTAEMVAWAEEVITAHPNYNVIVTTHSYLEHDGTTLDGADNASPTRCYNDGVEHFDGDDLWSGLISKYDNIVMVLCGHDPYDKIATVHTQGENGNDVTQMLVNPQDLDRDLPAGVGMVATLYFSEDGREVQVDYYSTFNEKYFKAENQFKTTVDVHKWDDGAVTQAATCQAPGVFTYTCQDCGKTKTVEIPMIDHTPADAVQENLQPASCVAEGSYDEVVYCAVCHTELSREQKTIEKTAHTLTPHAATTEDCTVPGSLGYWSCDVCGKFFSDEAGETEIEENSWVIAALGHALTKTEASPATCTEAGNTEYYTCARCGKFFSDEAGETEIVENSWVIPALGHRYGAPTWTWSGDLRTATATFTCANDSTHVETVDAAVTSEITQAATCEETGTETFTATVTFNGKTYTSEKTADVAAIGHAWGEASYTWSADNATVTATRVCANNAEHKETETVNATSVITTPATCEGKGVTTYTATFTNQAFQTQTKTETNVPALGHAYGAPTYTWSEDNATVTAKAICAHDETHVVTETVNTTATETTAATCETPGVKTYTATFENDLFKAQSKEVTLPAIGHSWNEPTYAWSEDNTTVTATRICAHDASHVETETVNATSAITTPATCETDGVKTYTASFVSSSFATQTKTEPIAKLGHKWNEGEITTPATCKTDGVKTFTCQNDPTHTYTEAIPATGHRYGQPVWSWNEDHTEATATFTCGNDSCTEETEGHVVVLTATSEEGITSETTEATHLIDGQTVYTATVAMNGETFTNTATVVLTAEGHIYGEPEWSWNADFTEATATFTCKEGDDTQTVTTTEITSKELTGATCTAEGTMEYAATVTFKEATYDTTTTGPIPKIAHNLTHHDPVPASCTATGLKEYWYCEACQQYFSDEGTTVVTYNDLVTDMIPHSYSEPVWAWSGYEAATATFTCTACGDAQILSAAITDKVTTEPTASEPGVRTYTAKVTFEGTEYTDTKTEELPPIGYQVTFTNQVGDLTPATLSLSNGLYLGETTLQVSCTNACTVGYTTDGGESYTTLAATPVEGTENTYAFTFDVQSEMEVVIVLKGDVDGNGKLTSNDSSLINRHIVKTAAHKALTTYQLLIADVDGNSKITSNDSSLINRAIVKTAAHKALTW